MLTTAALPDLFTPVPFDFWYLKDGFAYRFTPDVLHRLRCQKAMQVGVLSLQVARHRILSEEFSWADPVGYPDPELIATSRIVHSKSSTAANLVAVVLNARLARDAQTVLVESRLSYAAGQLVLNSAVGSGLGWVNAGKWLTYIGAYAKPQYQGTQPFLEPTFV